MGSSVQTKALLSNLLLFGTTAGADDSDPKLVGSKVGLYINAVAVTPNTVLADLTPASWTGYALSAAITWLAPVLSNQTTLPAVRGDAKTFTVTTQPDPAQTVVGHYIVAGDGTTLLLVKPWAQSRTPVDGTVIQVEPRLGEAYASIEPDGDVVFL